MASPGHWFYILYSLKDSKLYKGTCSDVEERFIKHTLGGTVSTKNRRPLILIFIRKFDSKSEALKYERFAKSLIGGKELRTLLVQNGILDSRGILSSDG